MDHGVIQAVTIEHIAARASHERTRHLRCTISHWHVNFFGSN
jgi:hypothetical protein